MNAVSSRWGSPRATTRVRLVKAVPEQLLGATWERCRILCTRNARDLVPRLAQGMVATTIGSIFEQRNEASPGSSRDGP